MRTPNCSLDQFYTVAKSGRSSKKIRNTDEIELPKAGIETMLIACLLGTKPRNAAEMTREDLLKDSGSCDWGHLPFIVLIEGEAESHSL